MTLYMGVTRLICESISAYIQERQGSKRILESCRNPEPVSNEDAQETINIDCSAPEQATIADDQMFESLLATYYKYSVLEPAAPEDDQLAESLRVYDYSTPPLVSDDDAQPL